MSCHFLVSRSDPEEPICGLPDVYSRTDRGALGTDLVRRDWLPLDWSGGTGQAYYRRDLLQVSLVEKRLLMFNQSGGGYDITLGPVWALDNGAAYPGMLPCGLLDANGAYVIRRTGIY